MTSVLVEQAPFGSTQFSECVADVFSADELTVTCPALDDRVVRVFKPGSWFTAIVYDDRQYPIVSFISRAQRDIDEAQSAHVATLVAAQRATAKGEDS